jgi:hypothetical protein
VDGLPKLLLPSIDLIWWLSLITDPAYLVLVTCVGSVTLVYEQIYMVQQLKHGGGSAALSFNEFCSRIASFSVYCIADYDG